MAYETGTASDYKDLLAKLITFLTSEGSVGTPSYSGTGDGTLVGFKTMPQAPSETWTLACSNATKVGVANYATTIAADSPVLHWRMNAVSGTTELDTTANNLDGTIVGTPTLSSAGLLSVDTDTCMTFDGVDDQVKSAASALVQIADADAGIDIVIEPTDVSGTRFIAGVGAAGATNADNYLISLWSEEGYLKIMHEYGAGNIESRVTSFKLAANTTYHLELSRDATNKTYTLYNGGVEVAQWQYVFPPSDGANAYFMVGNDADSTAPFAGRIDEAAFYSAQISAATAKSHAEAALGHETFTVTGSVSGAQANAIVGVPYQNTYIDFRIEDGAIDFVVTDQWTVAVTAGQLGTQAWAVNRLEKDHTVYLQGPGLAGTDEIFCYINVYEDTENDYFNWELGFADGYIPTADEAGQPNASPPSWVPLWNSAIPYWFVATGRRFIVIAKVSTTYHGCIGGLYLDFSTPTQTPYPVFYGGSSGQKTARWSDTTFNKTRLFCMSGLSTSYCRSIDGGWNEVTGFSEGLVVEASKYILHPYTSDEPPKAKVNETRDGIGGVYPLTPITIINLDDGVTKGVVGELDGCFHVTGFNNAAENIVNDPVSGYDHVVFHDVFRTGYGNYFALRIN